MKRNWLTQIWMRLAGSRSPQRRWLGIAIVCCLCIVLSGTVSAQQTLHLALLTTALDAQPGQSLAKEFERLNPGITIDIIEGPNASNLIEDLYTSSFLLGDSPYDLILMDVVWLPKFAAAGWLLDLSDRIPADQLSAFYPADLEGGRYNGKLYRLPIRSDAGLLYYRQDLLAQAGIQPPETFDQLVQASKMLQQSGSCALGLCLAGAAV